MAWREHGKDVGFYDETLTTVPDETRRLLEEYSHISPDRVIPHILEFVSPSYRSFDCPKSRAKVSIRGRMRLS